MIKYNPKIWGAQIFKTAKSDTLRILWREMILLAVFTLILTYVSINYFSNLKVLKDSVAVYSLIGFVLSLLLVFRTNTAYERWWEGRKKWGDLVNNARNLAIKLRSMGVQSESEAFFSRMIPNYAYALKEHLRSGVQVSDLDLAESEVDQVSESSHKPNNLALSMYRKLDSMKSG